MVSTVRVSCGDDVKRKVSDNKIVVAVSCACVVFGAVAITQNSSKEKRIHSKQNTISTINNIDEPVPIHSQRLVQHSCDVIQGHVAVRIQEDSLEDWFAELVKLGVDFAEKVCLFLEFVVILRQNRLELLPEVVVESKVERTPALVVVDKIRRKLLVFGCVFLLAHAQVEDIFEWPAQERGEVDQ